MHDGRRSAHPLQKSKIAKGRHPETGGSQDITRFAHRQPPRIESNHYCSSAVQSQAERSPVRQTPWDHEDLVEPGQPRHLCVVDERPQNLCGITGFTSKNWEPPQGRIRAATSTLIHRGPDQSGVFESRLFSMGATRLKIIDLHGGDQPILSEDGGTGIVFNGEIYNHLELRRELEERGHRFTSHSDTETVLHAFLEWDKECFSRLRGMFAIALWNKSEKRIVLARDRLGIKPLYISRQGEDVFFGSELKAIFAHPEIERHISLEGLDCYLSLNYVPCPWTLVDGIEKLPPGYWLEWRDGQVTSDSYWRLPFGPSKHWTLDSAKDELDGLMQSALREHLLSDVPLGVWLSGGIDSSAILHYAAQASSSQLKTFSISFRGRSFDETKYIRQVANSYGTDHHEMDLPPETNLRGAIEEFAYYADEPTADAGALPVWFLSKLSKTRTTVALSGEGADELFGGYLTYRANHLARYARAVPAMARRVALAAVRQWPVSDEKIGLEYKLQRFLEGSLLHPGRAHTYWNGTFSDAEKAALVRAPLPLSLNQILEELLRLPANKDALAAFLWLDQKYYLADDILTKSDRMSMAHSLEVRPPFLDHRIVEFAASLPADLKIRGSQQKFILRQLMRDKLPPTVLTRAKIGFDIPAHDWLRGPLRDLLVDTLQAGAAEHAELFNSEILLKSVRLHLERKANIGYHLWGLLILFLWMNKWQIQTSPRATQKVLAYAETGSSI
ncbi:MAG TPA: asparagine synthase (glutamine-hydrolyzing) [Candidatus Acidoferrales bacterium]|nr:asparagine synthase (glutamine-hydrolyzing) [Candidatus Acidoferrales bacterium]